MVVQAGKSYEEVIMTIRRNLILSSEKQTFFASDQTFIESLLNPQMGGVNMMLEDMNILGINK